VYHCWPCQHLLLLPLLLLLLPGYHHWLWHTQAVHCCQFLLLLLPLLLCVGLAPVPLHHLVLPGGLLAVERPRGGLM